MAKFTLLRLLHYSHRQKINIALASLYSILNKIFDIAPPLLIGVAVDVVVKRQDSLLASFGFILPQSQLWILALLTTIVWGLESIFQYLYEIKWRNLAQQLQHDFRLDCWNHIQDLDMAFFEERSSGGIMAILNDDVNQLERFLDVGANAILQIVTTIVVIGGIFFYFSPAITAMAMLPVPFILWGTFFFHHKLEPRYLIVREKVALLSARLVNSLGGIATIKSYATEKWESERLNQSSYAYQEANSKAISISSAFIPVIRMLIAIGFIATLVWGGLLTLEGKMAVGVYSVLIFLTQRLLWPLTSLAQTVDLYGRAMASTKRILDLLDTKATIISGDKKLEVPHGKGEIELKDVHFSYKSGAKVLKGINMFIPAGSTIGVVGSTGSGKTTLIKLLLRLYEISSGTIIIDGVNIQEANLTDLRHNIGLVSQDVFLFHGSVNENITYGSFKAEEQDIIKSAKLAEAEEFIQNLPQKYNTIVGERGQKLSGGQRQRLSIARAILKDPPILILDEATSSVDNETEAAIQRSLEFIAQNCTTIIIAHRLSTVRGADKIFVLEEGVLSEAGTHEELLQNQGFYARMWKVQTGNM